jgi:protein SCO1/2
MSILWVLTVLIMVSLIGASMWRKRQTAELPVLADVPAFNLVDQDDHPLTPAALAGKPWIADFVFTHCAGPCPMMTAKLAALQGELPSDVQLVSFSVDPDRDTPPVLKEYAQRFKADERRWHFLTGEKKAIYSTAAAMLVTAIPAKDDDPIIHDERFILVDADGKVRGYYHLKDEQAMASLRRDATALAEMGGR